MSVSNFPAKMAYNLFYLDFLIKEKSVSKMTENFCVYFDRNQKGAIL